MVSQVLNRNEPNRGKSKLGEAGGYGQVVFRIFGPTPPPVAAPAG